MAGTGSTNNGNGGLIAGFFMTVKQQIRIDLQREAAKFLDDFARRVAFARLS
jgi:hypothetical protein